MLYTDVLFSAETAADQLVFHDHLLRREAKHDTALVLGIIGTLVSGIDEYTVVKRHRNGTFRLQESVLCPWCLIMSCHFILGICDHFICISPYQMFMGKEIS